MKRGQGISLTTILLMVLGVVVVAVLIFGFSMGWDNFWGSISPFGGSAVNVDSIRTACSLACMQKAEYSFCSEKRDLTIEKGKTTTGSCFDFTVNSDLDIKDCDICSGSSSGCKVKGEVDVRCDGVGDAVVGGDGVGGSSSSISSGAIAISLPEESIDISYAAITSEDYLNNNGGVLT